MNLTDEQKKALELIREFATDNKHSVFVLRGYAGTGKTTLVKELIPMMRQLGRQPVLLAPTGRAAKVLKEKTGTEASTIHGKIYTYEAMKVRRHDENGNLIKNWQTKDDEDSKRGDDLQFWFALKENKEAPSQNIFIVDEASMISSRRQVEEFLHFGTDVLLDDLLTYVKLTYGGKIIFVGDPAQLPPVGDNRSAALDVAFFEEKGLPTMTIELKKVVRQDEGSAILENSMLVRRLLEKSKNERNSLCFVRKDGVVEDMMQESVVESFTTLFPTPDIGNSVIICYQNALAQDYNDAVRRRYFPDNKHVLPGDIVQVVKNNYRIGLGALLNGDFAKVVKVADEAETQSAPVWKDLAGKKQRVTITLEFRDVTLLTDSGEEIECKIVDTLLNSRKPHLSKEENIAMYINFRMRHKDLKQGEEAFDEALKHDPYFNAVQAKYGYAITCHKSQGGEWETAYVDYSARRGFDDDSLKWVYTATTRSSKMLYGVCIPDVTPLSKLEVRGIVKYGKPAKEACSYADARDVPFLPPAASCAQKQKCLCMQAQLEANGFELKGITLLQYNDRYLVALPSGAGVTVDCYYNGSGVYTRYVVQGNIPENELLMSLFENEAGMQYAVNYKPSNEALAQLHEKMMSICDEKDITVTNIVEYLSKYNVTYYLKTSGRFSQAVVYFKTNFAITHVIPSSDLGTEDVKLQQLVEALQN